MAELTFESVNKEIEELNLDQLALDLDDGKRQQALSPTSQICMVWGKIGGILRYIVMLPIPKKWKQAINLLIKTMDVLCK